MGNFFKMISGLNKKSKERKNTQTKNNTAESLNKTPTEDDLKNNKNGKKAIFLACISCVLYAVALAIVVSAFKSNIFIGFLSILLIPLVTILQKKAVYHAQKQREINGKGFFALIFSKYLTPLLALVAMLVLIFGINFLI